jgi:tetratricopeptide (TPR) repeat protein
MDVDGGTDADELATAGWCLYGLDRLDEALRTLRRSLQLSPASVETHFDIALVQLSQGLSDQAADDYGRAMHRADRQPRLRRRGLLRVALVDIDDARRVRDLPLASVTRCRSIVEQALQRTGKTELLDEVMETVVVTSEA